MEVPAPDSRSRAGVPPVREPPSPAAPVRAETPAGLASPDSGLRTRVLFGIVSVAMLVIAGAIAMSGDGMDLFMAAVAACFAGVLGYLAMRRREPDEGAGSPHTVEPADPAAPLAHRDPRLPWSDPGEVPAPDRSWDRL